MPLPAGFQEAQMTGYYPGNFDFANIRAQRMFAARFSRGRAAAGVQGIRLPTGAQIQQPGPARNMLPYFGAHAQHVYPDQYYYAYHHQYHQPPAVIAAQAHSQGVTKKTPQDLQELCSRNGWEPIFVQATYKDDAHNIYHGFTVTVHRPFGTKEYRSEHYCLDVEEARILAADGMYRSLQNEIYANAQAQQHKFAYAAFATPTALV